MHWNAVALVTFHYRLKESWLINLALSYDTPPPLPSLNIKTTLTTAQVIDSNISSQWDKLLAKRWKHVDKKNLFASFGLGTITNS